MPKIEESWDGFNWWIREGFRHDAITLTKREYSVLKVLTTLASKEKTFVEVGTHVGYYAVRMARLYKQVIAIEPNSQSLECLTKNIELNKVSNIQIIPVACGESDTELALGLMEGGSSFYRKNVPSIKVPVKRLDTLVEYGDVVKIDVEGWEENVIKGATRFVDTCKPIIIIEHHEFEYYPEAKGAYERIKNMLPNYRRFNLDCTRFAYVHQDKIKTMPREALGLLVGYHWFWKMLFNVKVGKPWYYGLPHTWWYGMGVLDVVENLPEHVLEEPEWLELIKNE
jgi:FkbM family methyltransferase